MSPQNKKLNQGFSGFILNTVIGIPVCFILTSMFVGGIEQAAVIIYLAIICTAGLSLVIIIPCCTLAGFITVSIYQANMKKETSSPQSAADQNNVVNQATEVPTLDCIAIATYLRQASESGQSQATSIDKLVAEGWSNEMIQEAKDYNSRTS